MRSNGVNSLRRCPCFYFNLIRVRAAYSQSSICLLRSQHTAERLHRRNYLCACRRSQLLLSMNVSIVLLVVAHTNEFNIILRVSLTRPSVHLFYSSPPQPAQRNRLSSPVFLPVSWLLSLPASHILASYYFS